MHKKVRRPLLYDPHIIYRVKQYLEENTHQTYVDVSEMTRSLQEKYSDYNRRKVAPFRQLVEQAYNIVLHSYGLASNSGTDDEGQSDESIELLDEAPPMALQSNPMVDVMNNLYNKRPVAALNNGSGGQPTGNAPQPGTDPGVSIDISSDESGDEKESSSQSNNAITNINNTINSNMTVIGDHDHLNGAPPASTCNDNKRVYPPEVQQIAKKRKMNPIVAPALSVQKAVSKKAISSKKEFAPKTPTLTFKDVGGLEKTLRELCELLLHMKHPELYEHIGLRAPRGFLLHGPPGSGKTLLAHAIAGQLSVPLIEVAATELVAGISGESEERIREVFEKAAAIAPCVLFIDEVDVISANRNNAQKDLERRIVAQLLSSLDSLAAQVVVIGATNRADTLDPALRRVGRFDQEICLGIPDRVAREQILRIICSPLKLLEPFNYDELAVLTPGYVGADLLALAIRAASIAIKRAFSKAAANKESEPVVPKEDGQKAVEGANEEGTADPAVVTENQMEVDEDPGTALSEPKLTDVNDEKPVEKNEDETKAIETEKVTNGIPAIEEMIPEVVSKPELLPEKETNGEAPVEDGNQPAVEMKPVGDVNQPQTLNEMIGWLDKDKANPISQAELALLCITMEDFKEAVTVVQPSAKREGFITVPDVTWDDIGSLRDIRDELKLAILAPVKYPKKLELLGLQSPSGVLLCGPPGCGKTLLAKAVANEAGINFISVKGPELLNMYVGESERAVRQCFQRAKNSAPCVIFFDEFDALCPKRSARSDNSSGARVVNQLLTEMDGVEDRRGVFLMAATNRPDMIDGAVLRPGRLDKILYVGLPEVEDRQDILRALTKNGNKPKLDADVNLGELAELSNGFTGADLGGLVREASLRALKDSLLAADAEENEEEMICVKKRHFVDALSKIKPSVGEEDKRNYARLQKLYAVQETTV